jgi:hypothetical protein
VAGGALGLSLLYAAVVAAVFPYPLHLLPWNQDTTALAWNQVTTALASPYRYAYAEEDLATLLPRALAPGTRILTENAYTHRAIAAAGANYDLVPVWSPEVAFLFDPGLDPIALRRQLLDRNITSVFVYPNSPNTAFCVANSPFYRQDRPNWREIGNFKNVFVIYGLPAPLGLTIRGFSSTFPGPLLLPAP